MNEKLDLSLPTNDRSKKPPSHMPSLLLILILLGVLVNVGLSIRNTPGKGAGKGTSFNRLGVDALKKLALKYEKQGLQEQAVVAWRSYLDAAESSSEESAKVLYRIGKLHQENRQYGSAVDAYYRSESHAKVDELSSEISRRIESCLEAMGKFSAVRYELAERVGLGASSNALGKTVVAELGPRKITQADLDRMIEADIDRQMQQFASFLPPEEQARQKQSLLSRFTTSAQRKAFLQQFIFQEILSRKAREQKLHDDPRIQEMLKQQERGLLAQKIIEKHYKDRINITAGDLKTYYEANKSNYKRPEQAAISHILVESEEGAKTVEERLANGASFEDVAKELSMDEATKADGGKLPGFAQKGGSIPGLDYAQEANERIFQTSAGQVCAGFFKTPKGFHLIKVRERKAEEEKPFEEVRNEVYRALRQKKELEVQEGLMADLKNEYEVVLHNAAFPAETKNDG